MLTKNDIKQIRNVFREEIVEQLYPLKQDVGSLKQDMVFVKKSLRGLKMKTTRINNTLNVAIKVFDRNGVENRKKIQRIEDHLGLVA